MNSPANVTAGEPPVGSVGPETSGRVSAPRAGGNPGGASAADAAFVRPKVQP